MQYNDIDPKQDIADLVVEKDRTVFVRDLEAVDGTDLMVPVAPGSPESVSLKFSEQQVRDLANKFGDLVEGWDFLDDDFGK